MKIKKSLCVCALVCILLCAMLLPVSAAERRFDVNGDYKISLSDCLATLRSVAAEDYDVKTDFNEDGENTLADLFPLLRAVVNGETNFRYSYTDIVSRLYDTKFLSTDAFGEVSLLASSYDRTSKYENGEYVGWRGNNDGSYSDGTTEDGGNLYLDVTGAGYISRIWTVDGHLDGNLRIYIDGKILYDLPFTDYFTGSVAPFNYENLCYEASKGHDSYVPITFNESCKIVGYGKDNRFYQITYTLFPDGVEVESMPSTFTEEQAAALERANTFFGAGRGAHPDGLADAPFETYTVEKGTPVQIELSGKGAISGFLANVLSIPADLPDVSIESVEALKNLRLKIYWDGQATPAVDTPLGDFFACSYGFDEARSALLGVRDDRTLYNYYYMPYLTGATIELTNISDTPYDVALSLNIVEHTAPASETLYFGAQFNLGHYHEDAVDAYGDYDASGSRSPDYNFLKVTGEGRLVGVNLHLSKTIDGIDPQSNPGSPWWGEGDEKFFVDGRMFPDWYGTGTEDFFGYAWCSPQPFARGLHMQSYCVGDSNNIGNRVITRVMTADSLPFNTSFEGYLEKYYTESYVKYGFTSYFYLAPDAVVTDVRYDSEAPLDYFVPERKIYRDFIEGEEMTLLDQSGFSILTQNMAQYSPAWSGDSHRFFTGEPTVGAYAELQTTAPCDGDYMLLASFTTAPDYGMIEVSANGEALGSPIDTYGPSVAADNLSEIGVIHVTNNQATLKFTVVGKNEQSSHYRFGLDFVLFVPVEEYTSLAEFDLAQYTSRIRINTLREPSIDQTNYHFEGELHLQAHWFATEGSRSVQSMTAWDDEWSGDSQLFWKNSNGSTAAARSFIWVEQAGTYHITAGLTAAPDYGIFRLTVNGKVLGTFDGYDTKVTRKIVEFGAVDLKSGWNKLQFAITGKNERSKGYCAGFDFFDAIRYDAAATVVREAETDLLPDAVSSAGNFSAQSMTVFGTAWSGGKQILWQCPAAGSTLTTTLNADESGDYLITLGYTVARDFGKTEIYINGELVGSYDGFNNGVQWREMPLGKIPLSAGANTVEFRSIGKNDAAVGFFVGIDALRLQKIN